MTTLADKLKPHVADIEADAKAGDKGAIMVIDLYGMHCDCPSDPGAPALCEAAFDDWREAKTGMGTPPS